MSFSFTAQFDTTSYPLDKILDELQRVFDENDIHFLGEATPMASLAGHPTVDLNVPIRNAERLTATSTSTLREAARVAKDWWGVSLLSLSRRVRQYIGRSTAAEVDFVLYPGTAGRWTLQYEEDSTVWEYRSENEEAAADLTRLQLSLCQRLGFKISVYEEDDNEAPPSLDSKYVERALAEIKRVNLARSVVVSSQAIAFDDVRARVGKYADRVRMTTDGFVVLSCLKDE